MSTLQASQSVTSSSQANGSSSKVHLSRRTYWGTIARFGLSVTSNPRAPAACCLLLASVLAWWCLLLTSYPLPDSPLLFT